MKENNYKKLITDAIEFYKSSKKDNIDEILFDFLNEQKITKDESESKNLISGMTDIIDKISANYDHIKAERTYEKDSKQIYEIIIESLRSSLSKQPESEQLNISKTILQKIEEISGDKEKNRFDILDSPIEYSEVLNKNLNKIIELDALTVGELSSEITDNLPQENKTLDLNDFYNSEFNSNEEKNIKKILSVANYVAAKKKFIKFSENENEENLINESIPYIVDKSLSQNKIYFKYGNNNLSTESVFEEFIDRYTAILLTIVKENSVVMGHLIGSRIGSFIGSIFGPVGTSIGYAIGSVVGGISGEAIGETLNAGINKLNSVVKELIDTLAEVAKTFLNIVKNKLINLFA